MRSYLLIALGILLLPLSTAVAVPSFFVNDATGWSNDVIIRGYTEVPFSTGEGAIALANEVSIPPNNVIDGLPPNNTDLGSTLTWHTAKSGLPLEFRLQALQPGAGLVTDDFENNASIPSFPAPSSSLSIGDFGDFTNDDWRIDFIGGRPVVAFQFQLLGNIVDGSESYKIFDTNGNLILQMTGTGVGGTQLPSGQPFIGVVSDVPIGFVTFDEDSGPNDIALLAFSFAIIPATVDNAIPEPATLLLFAFGSAVMFQRRRIG